MQTKLHEWPQSQVTVVCVPGTTEKHFGWGLCLDREDRKHLEVLGGIVIIICGGDQMVSLVSDKHWTALIYSHSHTSGFTS